MVYFSQWQNWRGLGKWQTIYIIYWEQFLKYFQIILLRWNAASWFLEDPAASAFWFSLQCGLCSSTACSFPTQSHALEDGNRWLYIEARPVIRSFNRSVLTQISSGAWLSGLPFDFALAGGERAFSLQKESCILWFWSWKKKIPHWRIHGRHYIILLKPLATDIWGHDGLIILFLGELQEVASVKNFNKVILIWADNLYSTYEKNAFRVPSITVVMKKYLKFPEDVNTWRVPLFCLTWDFELLPSAISLILWFVYAGFTL